MTRCPAGAGSGWVFDVMEEGDVVKDGCPVCADNEQGEMNMTRTEKRQSDDLTAERLPLSQSANLNGSLIWFREATIAGRPGVLIECVLDDKKQREQFLSECFTEVGFMGEEVNA